MPILVPCVASELETSLQISLENNIQIRGVGAGKRGSSSVFKAKSFVGLATNFRPLIDSLVSGMIGGGYFVYRC